MKKIGLIIVLSMVGSPALAEDFLAEHVLCEKHKATITQPWITAAPGSQYEAGFDGPDKCDGRADRARAAAIAAHAAELASDKDAFTKALTGQPNAQ